MTETGRDLTWYMREWLERRESHSTPHEGFMLSEKSVGALLAVVEAAQDVRENSKQAIGMEDPWGSQGPPILVSASMWFELADKLEVLHSQASDEG